MSYAHCVVKAQLPEHVSEIVMDALLGVVVSQPSIGHGVYVVVVAPTRTQARDLGNRIAKDSARFFDQIRPKDGEGA